MVDVGGGDSDDRNGADENECSRHGNGGGDPCDDDYDDAYECEDDTDDDYEYEGDTDNDDDGDDVGGDNGNDTVDDINSLFRLCFLPTWFLFSLYAAMCTYSANHICAC